MMEQRPRHNIQGPVIIRCPSCGYWIRKRIRGKSWRDLPPHSKPCLWTADLRQFHGLTPCEGGVSEQYPVMLQYKRKRNPAT